MSHFKFFIRTAQLLFFAVFVSFQPTLGQASIEDKIQGIMKENETIGLAVAVVKGDEIIYSNSFGWKDRENRIPLAEEDIFRIASISKSFSVVAIMQLIEAGKVSLEDDVSDLVGFKVRNPKFPDTPITLGMLLSHTSSINDRQAYGNLDIINPAVNDTWQKSYNEYAPGTDFQYCNLNFNMLGAIIEGLAGERFDLYIKRHILDPLHLYGGFHVDSLDASKFAKLYFHEADRGEYSYRPVAYATPNKARMNHYKMGYSAAVFSPTGGMKISAKDLAKYMIMHMNHGRNGTGRILSEENAKLMQTAQVQIDSVASYGYGIRITDALIPGKTMTGHTGSAQGLFSSMFFNLEDDFGIVVITNGTRRDTREGMNALIKSVNMQLYDEFIGTPRDLADQVVIRRTHLGVPHIHADNMEAASFAMGYLQVEDYGRRVVNGLIRARGEWAKNNELRGRQLENQLQTDASSKLQYERAVETFGLLNKQTQDLLRGYAQGVNRYIEMHRDEFPAGLKADFTALDVHAKSIGRYSNAAVTKFLDALGTKPDFEVEDTHPEEGSNVWALAPSRTTSGNAILMRNPHLTWTAGYYEAHMIIPGQLNFYGDFRVGEPLGIVGGFNDHLGWSTTNNYTDNEEIYAFAKDPQNPDRYLLDGKSHAFITKEVPVEFKRGRALENTTKSFLFTPYGPVIHQTTDMVYIIRAANEGEYRTNEQFLKMMGASNLEEWKDAMRMQARVTSNFTYADQEGNIFYVWNGSIPAISHPSGKDTSAVFVTQSSEIWTELLPWDDLPQLLNPAGGYVRNENDPFHYTNLNEVFDEADYPDNFPKAQLRLRSQLSLQLIGNDDKLSLEEVMERKHDMTALLADRVKEDLIQAVERTNPSGKTRRAINQIKNWDNTVAADSRGSLLFKIWWNRYVRLAAEGKRVTATPESAGYAAPAEALFIEPWSKNAPTTTPRGLANKDHAVEAFEWAIKDAEKRHGNWDLAWGDVHRASLGDEDYAVGGASGDLGAFRVLWFEEHKNDRNKLQISGGDCWVFAVEFGETPRAYSILPYGQSNKSSSPYFANQLKMFAENEMKPIAFTQKDILESTIKTYRPGKQ